MNADNQKISRLFYLLAAWQIVIISGGAALGLLVAPAGLFASRTEDEAFIWIASGFAGCDF